MVKIAESYFGVREDERLHIFLQDGLTYVSEKATAQQRMSFISRSFNGFTFLFRYL